MKRLALAAFLLTLMLSNVRAEPLIDSTKAAFYVGQAAMVCGPVHGVTKFSKGTYLNIGARHPRQHITFVIWDSDQSKFNERFGSLAVFDGAQACARGVIETYRNALQVKVSNPQFLRLMK